MNLFQQIEEMLPQIVHGWTTPDKGKAMAAAIVTLRPDVSIELGVFAGKGLIAMGLAHKSIGKGIAIGIDPYSATESADGQIKPEDQKFWSELDHEFIYRECQKNILNCGVQNFVRIIREKSQTVKVPEHIGVLRIDGNHGETVLVDVARFTPNCDIGAILFLDDENWTGGAVAKAAQKLPVLGWRELYKIDDGSAWQKVK